MIQKIFSIFFLKKNYHFVPLDSCPKSIWSVEKVVVFIKIFVKNYYFLFAKELSFKGLSCLLLNFEVYNTPWNLS